MVVGGGCDGADEMVCVVVVVKVVMGGSGNGSDGW